jgi:hypothetical protein
VGKCITQWAGVEWEHVKHSVEFNRFTNAVEHIMAVPKAEILRREAEYKKIADANPNKRGPKPKRKRKVKPSVSSGRAV